MKIKPGSLLDRRGGMVPTVRLGEKMKIKKRHWDGASLTLDIALEIIKERPHFDDMEYGRLLLKAVESVELASEYAHIKSLKKKEREELYGSSEG